MADQETRAEPAEPVTSQAEAEMSEPLDDAHDQTPAEELAEMEARIRGQLQGIVRRAKQAETDARALIGRVKPMIRTRKSVIALTDPDNQQIARLSATAHRMSRATARSIGQITKRIKRNVVLRHEIGAGRDQAWRRFERVVIAPAEAWFRAVASRGGATKRQLGRLRARIRRGEKRWHSKGRSGQQQSRSSSKARSSANAVTDRLIRAKRIDE